MLQKIGFEKKWYDLPNRTEVSFSGASYFSAIIHSQTFLNWFQKFAKSMGKFTKKSIAFLIAQSLYCTNIIIVF
jgi:hypothetical protein